MMRTTAEIEAEIAIVIKAWELLGKRFGIPVEAGGAKERILNAAIANFGHRLADLHVELVRAQADPTANRSS